MTSLISRFAVLWVGSLSFAPIAFAQPTVPGFVVETYASVTDPVSLSFAPNGDLYVGRDLLGSGGSPADPTRIHRVLAGGAVVEEFGTAIDDPDAVLFDALASIAPTTSSVLVGSQVVTQGKISAISSGGVVSTVIGPSSTFTNPSDMVFDDAGRLLFTDHQNQDVKVTTGGLPTTLFTISSRTIRIAYDPTGDRVYTSGLDGTIRAHLADGTLLDAAFSTGRAVAVGPGSAGFGNDVYSVDNATGELLRTDAAGNASVVGTGFVSVFDLAFGPDGALYASEFDDDRIVRISVPIPPGLPALSAPGLLAAAFLLIAAARSAIRRPARTRA